MHGMKVLPLGRLSAILEPVAQELGARFGLTKLYIGGGSAPALLDHLFAGSALCMRDIDLVLLADQRVGRELAHSIGSALEAPAMRFLPRYVYPRRRARSPDEELWVAGWGALWDVEGMEVDLSIFHDRAALGLNGLMDVDRVLIPLSADKALNERAARMLALGSAQAAAAAGLVDDSAGGYRAWAERAPTIVAWNAVQAAPTECAMRIIRTCVNKLQLTQLDAELAVPLRAALLDGPERGDRFVRVRTLLKLFHDDRAGVELGMLHQLSAFASWLPGFGALIGRLGEDGLTTLFARAAQAARHERKHRALFAVAGEQGADEVSALRLQALLRKLPQSQRALVIDEVAIAEPTFAALLRGS